MGAAPDDKARILMDYDGIWDAIWGLRPTIELMGRRRPGRLGHRGRCCCRYCGIPFIAVVCLLFYISLCLIQYVIA